MSKTDIEAEVTSAMALLDDLSPRSSDSGLSEDTCWALFGGPCPEALRKKIRPKVDTYTEPEEVEEWHSAEMIPVDEKKQSVDKFVQDVDKKKSSSVVLKTSDDKNDKTASDKNIPDQKSSFSDQTDKNDESVVLENSKTSENTQNAVPVASNHSKFEALQEVDVVTSRKSLNKDKSKSSKVLISKTSLATPNKESESQQQVLLDDNKETSRSSKESNRLDQTTILNTNSANTILEIQKAPSPSESLLIEITSPENAAKPTKSELEVVSSIKSSKPESLEVIVPTESKSKTPSASSLAVEPPSSDRQQQTASPITINASAMTSKASIPKSPQPPSEKSFSSVVTPPSSRFSTLSSSESTSGSKSCFCRCCVERQVRNSRGRGSFKKRNCKCNCCLSNFKIKIYEGPEESSRPTNFLKFVSFNEDEITYHNKRIQTSVLTLPNAPKPAGLEPKKLKDCICGSGDYKQSTTSCSTKPIAAPPPRNDTHNLVKSLTNILKKRSTVKEVVNQFESRNGRCCGPSKRPMRLLDPVYHPVKPQPPRNGICICCSKPKEEHRTCFKHSNIEQNHRCCTWQEY